jgi:ribosomal protein S18 acetylase RimI-like enzyme
VRTSWLVRPATEADTEGVRILAQTLTTAFPFDSAAFGDAFLQVLKNPLAILLVAEWDQQVLGYLLGYRHTTFWAGADVWWVEELCVESSHRRCGIGRALMVHFEELAHAKGARLVCLITGKAKEFYQALGYEERAVYLRKDLHRT